MQNRYRLAWMWIAVVALAVPIARADKKTGTSGTDGLQPAETDGGTKPDVTKPDGTKPDGTKPDGGGKDGGKKDGGGKDGGGGLFGGNMLFIMIGVFVLMYFLMSRGKRKQEKKRKSMLSELKKGDKITTIGGVVGTVIEVKEDEVTVKVDETNNIRMKFARWAIRGVGATAKTEKSEDGK